MEESFVTYQVGETVRVAITDTSDPDRRYHDEVGEIVEVLQDDLSGITGDARDDFLYRVEFEDEALGRLSFRHHDLERVE